LRDAVEELMNDFATLPSDPSRREVILVLSQVDADRLDMEDSRAIALRSDVSVLDANAARNSGDEFTTRLARRGLVRPGITLLQSPYDENQYVELQEAADLFALDKFTAMSVLVQHLGARSLRVSAVEDEKSSERWEANASATKSKIKTQAKSAHNAAEALGRRLQLCDEYPGSTPDVASAREHLRQWRLDHDRELVSLIDARSVAANPLKRRTLSLDLSSESERQLDLVAGLSLPGFLSMKADYKRVVSTAAHYRVEYTIEY
jgi:hypothetical protein